MLTRFIGCKYSNASLAHLKTRCMQNAEDEARAESGRNHTHTHTHTHTSQLAETTPEGSQCPGVVLLPVSPDKY